MNLDCIVIKKEFASYGFAMKKKMKEKEEEFFFYFLVFVARFWIIFPAD